MQIPTPGNVSVFKLNYLYGSKDIGFSIYLIEGSSCAVLLTYGNNLPAHPTVPIVVDCEVHHFWCDCSSGPVSAMTEQLVDYLFRQYDIDTVIHYKHCIDTDDTACDCFSSGKTNKPTLVPKMVQTVVSLAS